jgi:hypothetical protein
MLVLAGCASGAPARAPGATARDEAPPLAAQPSPVVHAIDRSTLGDVGSTAPLDYENPALWACRPGNAPNECQRDLNATEIGKDGTRRVTPHARAQNPAFDCFYVYPTVKLTGTGNMTDFSDAGIALVNDALLAQAARFSRLCEVYAPLYRQTAVDRSSGTPKPAAGASRELAVGDVRAAFKHYLEHDNRGRRFVILGHSQGTAMLTAMMQEDVDPVPEVRARLISALLIGGGVHVASGQRAGGTFKNIPTCSAPGETGCVIAFASFAAEAPPAKDSRFAAAPAPGMELACTEPAALSGNTGRYRGSYFRQKINNPTFKSDQPLPEGLTTPFALYRDAFTGQCVKRDGLSYLEISLAQDPGDTRGVPPYRSKALEAAGVGLHVVDYNIPLEDLIEAARLQAASALGGEASARATR